MKTKSTYIVFILLIGFNYSIKAQDTSNQSLNFETIIESIVENLEENTDFSSLLEDLENYYENPLNINSASEFDLTKLHLLNEVQIINLLNFRKNSGDLVSIFEMNTIDGFSREILERIQPFITFEPLANNQIKGKPLKYANHQILARSTKVIQKKDGYRIKDGSSPKYEGSPEKLYTRYKFKLGNKINAGFTAEKDPGESLFQNSNKNGFDYYSAHLNINFNSLIKNITLGDFIVRSGQGLAIWQGFATGKSADVLNISKNGQGTRAYSSTDENRFFRGLTVGFKLSDFDLQIFYSNKQKDANLSFRDSTNIPEYFTSLQTSGYHRTENEIANEKSIRETASGAIVSFRKNRLKLGATILLQQFNIPYIRENNLNNYYRFKGSKNVNVGIDYYYISGKYQFFGEAAISKSKGKAFIQGIMANVHDQATFSFLFRHYDKNFQTIYGDSFSEGSGNINETGFYSAIKLLPIKKIKFYAYADLYKTPWFTYNTIAPSKGFDILAQVNFLPSKKINMYLRFKKEEREIKSANGKKYINTNLINKRLRFHFQYNPTLWLNLKSRLEYSYYYKSEKQKGFLIYQDLIFTPPNIPLTAQFRFAYINTDNYNSRIYSYENDMLYNYSIPAYYGKSIRTYINFHYKFSKKISLWLKASNTSFSDREAIGSGYNKISGKNLTEVKIQSQLRF